VPDDAAGDAPLRAASTLALLEATALIAAVIARTGSARPLLVAALIVKVPFCLFVRRRSAGAFFGLLLWEAAGVVGALAADAWIGMRMVFIASAIAVIVLLFRSVHLFPTSRLPDWN
jgi:hypothetical protein